MPLRVLFLFIGTSVWSAPWRARDHVQAVITEHRAKLAETKGPTLRRKNNADTYEYWFAHGVCSPGVDRLADRWT